MICNFSSMTVGLIGAGRMGLRHLHAVQKLGLRVVGVVDQNPNSLKTAQNEHNLSDDVLFLSQDDFYQNRVPDCLIISTTADSHCMLTCMAAEMGVKYILVEKPMAVSLRQCKKMIEVCDAHGALLSVNHQMRFMDQYGLPKAMLDNSEYGGCKSMTVVGGNIGMAMNALHYFEAFRFVMDEELYEVTAWFDENEISNPRGIQFKDCSGSIRATTALGKRLYVEIGSDQGHGLQVIYAGRNGLISINELTGEMFSNVRQSPFRDLPTTRYGMPSDRSSVNIAAVEVVDSSAIVLKSLLMNDNRVTGEEGMMAVKALIAAYTSYDNKSSTVRIDSALDADRIFPWA